MLKKWKQDVDGKANESDGEPIEIDDKYEGSGESDGELIEIDDHNKGSSDSSECFETVGVK